MSDSSISLTPQSNGVNGGQSGVSGTAQQSGSAGASEQGAKDGSKAVKKENISREQLDESAKLLNKSAQVLKRDIRFNVVPSEDVIQAEIRNAENDEVIKKIPPDEMIELRKKIDSFIGLFVDEER